MAERESVLKTSVTYDGIFEPKEVTNIIRDLASDKGFSLTEGDHTESVTSNGKFIEIAFELGKKVTDYAKESVMIKIQMQDLKEKIVEKNKKKKKFFVGKLIFNVEGVLVTDYEKRWETKPVFYTIRVLFEKFIYAPHLSKHKEELTQVVNHLKDNVRSYLNLTRF